jgi:hypothetical protein
VKSGKEIIRLWAEECLQKREDGKLPFDPDSGHYAGILTPEWQCLLDRIESALREAKQEGLEYRKHLKILEQESEFGPFWQKFYLDGVVGMSGVAQQFGCHSKEELWINQWNEVIRIHFKKPLLRAVDPELILDLFTRHDMIEAFTACKNIIAALAQQAPQANEVQSADDFRNSLARLKGGVR